MKAGFLTHLKGSLNSLPGAHSLAEYNTEYSSVMKGIERDEKFPF